MPYAKPQTPLQSEVSWLPTSPCLGCAVLRSSVMSDSSRPSGLEPTRLFCPQWFPRQEYWSGLPCPPPGDLPNSGIKSRSPALQADSSILSESPGKPKNTGVGSLSLLQGLFLTQESSWLRNQTGVSCIAGGFFTNWATREAPFT